MAKEVLLRNQIPEELTWDLTPIFQRMRLGKRNLRK